MRRLLAVATLIAIAPLAAGAQEPPARAGGAQRAVTSTGVTKPPGSRAAGQATYSRANTEADMKKAQGAAAARDKAWDSKTRATMGSICKGC